MPPLESKGVAVCGGGIYHFRLNDINKESYMSCDKSIMKSNARQLRANMTDHELLIWYYIRRKRINNIQFYRQKHLGPFIVDFYAPSIRLALEIDGSQHFEKEHYEQDKFRDAYLREAKIHVLRFNNHEVKYQMNSVLEKLNDVIEQIKQFGTVKD
ncbi:MAG: endonuclease domain-containing protein [Candidatus Berkiella sp.]